MINFFKESNGELSMTRLIVFILVIYAMLLTSIIYYISKDVTQCMTSFGTITTIAATWKLVQKTQESKQTKT